MTDEILQCPQISQGPGPRFSAPQAGQGWSLAAWRTRGSVVRETVLLRDRFATDPGEPDAGGRTVRIGSTNVVDD